MSSRLKESPKKGKGRDVYGDEWRNLVRRAICPEASLALGELKCWNAGAWAADFWAAAQGTRTVSSARKTNKRWQGFPARAAVLDAFREQECPRHTITGSGFGLGNRMLVGLGRRRQLEDYAAVVVLFFGG